MRGFLWQDLSSEIAEECSRVELLEADLVRLGGFCFDQAGAWSTPREPGMSADLRRRRGKARARAKGLCGQCQGSPAQPNRVLCERCALKRERNRKAVKMETQVTQPQPTTQTREKLAEDREGLTHHFSITGYDDQKKEFFVVDGYIVSNTYPDGRLAEFFIQGLGKVGSDTRVNLDAWAMAASMAFQWGCDPYALLSKNMYKKSEICGTTTNKDIPRCSSIIDYCAKYLIQKFNLQPPEPKEGGAS